MNASFGFRRNNGTINLNVEHVSTYFPNDKFREIIGLFVTASACFLHETKKAARRVSSGAAKKQEPMAQYSTTGASFHKESIP